MRYLVPVPSLADIKSSPAFVRARWRWRNFWRAYWRNALSPVRDKRHLLGMAVAIAGAVAAVQSGGLWALITEADAFAAWVETMLSIVPLWLVLALFFAINDARQFETDAGKWVSNSKFQYHEKKLIGAIEWRPEHNGTPRSIDVKHAPSNALLYVDLEFYPRTDRIRAALVFGPDWTATREGMYACDQWGAHGISIRGGKLWILADSLPETRPVTIRAYCHYFIAGKADVTED